MGYSLSKSTLMSGAFLLVFGGFGLAEGPYYLRWEAGSGGSCIDACERSGAKAIVSGQYRNLPSVDQSFALCTANARNEGHRVGFNIVSSGPRCRVAHGDQGLHEEGYLCLCSKEDPTGPIKNFDWVSAGGGSCIDHCKRYDREAVKGGQYRGLPSEDQSFTVCRASAENNDGKRVGFNIVSSGPRCRVAYGDEGLSPTDYDCLCQQPKPTPLSLCFAETDAIVRAHGGAHWRIAPLLLGVVDDEEAVPMPLLS